MPKNDISPAGEEAFIVVKPAMGTRRGIIANGGKGLQQ